MRIYRRFKSLFLLVAVGGIITLCLNKFIHSSGYLKTFSIESAGRDEQMTKEHLQSDEERFLHEQDDIYEQDFRDGDQIFDIKEKLRKMKELESRQQKEMVEEKQPKQVKELENSEQQRDPSNINSTHLQDFHPIDIESRYLLYSAHHDISQAKIKLVGFGPMHDNHKQLDLLRCVVTNGADAVEIANVSVYYRISTFYPWEGQEYDSYIYACNTNLPGPTRVEIQSNIDKRAFVKLPVAADKMDPMYEFAVCVEPLFDNYDDMDSLRHFIAVNSMFGAEHFYFYALSASSRVMDFLKTQSMTTVYPWPLNALAKKLHAFGQKASNAHCLYNHRHRAKYLSFIDIDEVLVPKTSTNWSSMVKEVFTNQMIGAAVFKSKLFPKNVLTDQHADSEILQKKLWSLSHVQTVGAFLLYQWSKVLVDTSKTDIVDIHMIRKMLPGYKVVNVTSANGVVHHYRNHKYSQKKLNKDIHMRSYERALLAVYHKLFSS